MLKVRVHQIQGQHCSDKEESLEYILEDNHGIIYYYGIKLENKSVQQKEHCISLHLWSLQAVCNNNILHMSVIETILMSVVFKPLLGWRCFPLLQKCEFVSLLKASK
jgi:hypothetical protein